MTKIDLGAPLRHLLEQFGQKNIALFCVGGCVRNKLLSLPVKDIDVCAAHPPASLLDLSFKNIMIHPREYGLGTLIIEQCFEDAQYTYEYTAFRKDNYGRQGSHKPEHIQYTSDILEDAKRRDFTINALYADKTGAVADPTGRGLADLERRSVAQIMPFTISEDALRIMRMVRFACTLGFSIEPDTLTAAKENISKLANISKERVRDEFFMILLADTAYGQKDGVLRGLELLKELGALQYIIPSLLSGEGFAQNAEYHKYDVLDHAIHSCAAAPPDLITRLAALLHDIAKPSVYFRDHNMYAHPEDGAHMAEQTLAALRTPKDITEKVSGLVRRHMFDLGNSAKEKAVLRLLSKLGREQFLRLIELRRADFLGSGKGNEAKSADKWQAILEKLEQSNAPIEKSALKVNGHDIMKELQIGPSPLVGHILAELHTIALKKPSQNNYKSLIRYARMIYTRYR
ncbi:MAG: CCA tRNA nucleotidyltransferase [Christensenellaceae bacterium]